MDQSRALNALAPFLALAKSATSPRAAADLITQATSTPNTYVFAELLQQPNIQKLTGDGDYGNFHELLKVFAWGTWEGYKATPGLPQLSDAQATKLRLLSLLTIASQKQSSASLESHLSYAALCTALSLDSSIDLEHLVTQAIYNDLITATLNPASQTVVIASVAPLRDLAPGSIGAMISELAAWSGRCDSVLAELEAEMAKVKAAAKKRHTTEKQAEKQIKAVTDAADKGSGLSGAGGSRLTGSGMAVGSRTRGARREAEDDGDDDDDPMELDSGAGTGTGLGGGGKKRTAGGLQNLFNRAGGRSGGR